jgi:hypothetical protein
MKAWIALLLTLGCCAARGALLLAWDRSSSSTVVGYKIYYGVQPTVYTNSIMVGNVLTSQVTSLKRGVYYYFAVTAYAEAGKESDFSNETLALAYGEIILQTSTNAVGGWVSLTSAPVRDFLPQYLRVRINRLPDQVRVLNLPDAVPVIIYPIDLKERRRFFRAIYRDP